MESSIECANESALVNDSLLLSESMKPQNEIRAKRPELKPIVPAYSTDNASSSVHTPSEDLNKQDCVLDKPSCQLSINVPIEPKKYNMDDIILKSKLEIRRKCQDNGGRMRENI